MSTEDNLQEAIEGLQQLGLQEYEARCFVGLSRVSSATAKTLSEVTEVPRTRVYDAIRVLESKGLVEIHHSSPQQFRSVPLEEGMETLRDQYESRVERVHRALEEIDVVESGDESPIQEVWSISGGDAIENRVNELVRGSSEEVVLVVGHDNLLTPKMVETLNAANGTTDVLVGAVTEELMEKVNERVPQATTFTTGLEWVRPGSGTEVKIGQLLLVDRSALLVSSVLPDTSEEHAIYGRGFGNGLVILARRIMSRGLVPIRDPGEADD